MSEWVSWAIDHRQIICAIAEAIAMTAAAIATCRFERAMSLADVASERASLAIRRVSSSRALRLEAAASSRNACCSASQADACAPISPPLAASMRVYVSPCDSNAARCSMSRDITEPPPTQCIPQNLRDKLDGAGYSGHGLLHETSAHHRLVRLMLCIYTGKTHP